MIIADIINHLEQIAPPWLQESYDNTGLIIGNKEWNCTGIMVSLDATEEVVLEAIDKKCNLIVAHHPILFSGLKKINGNNYVEKAVIAAIKNDIAIYAIHTNLDNVLHGVNAQIADKLGLINCKILSPKKSGLKKLYTYVPIEHADKLANTLFEAGGGSIGNYIECSFATEGMGSFKGLEGTNPYSGKVGERHYEKEKKLEIIFETWKEKQLINALIKNHPYEEVAYEIINLDNTNQYTGSGLIGELENKITAIKLFDKLRNQFNLSNLKYTKIVHNEIKRIAVCGGAGSFLTANAIAAGADMYITSDVKYHEFFDANDKLILVDIGHWESEQFTIDYLATELSTKFPTFAVLKTGVDTNPVKYWA